MEDVFIQIFQEFTENIFYGTNLSGLGFLGINFVEGISVKEQFLIYKLPIQMHMG